MANFDTTQATLSSVGQATGVLSGIRGVYSQAKQVQVLLALYAANTDAKFVAAVNTIFSPAERTELQAMLADVNTLVTNWEASHKAPLGLP